MSVCSTPALVKAYAYLSARPLFLSRGRKGRKAKKKKFAIFPREDATRPDSTRKSRLKERTREREKVKVRVSKNEGKYRSRGKKESDGGRRKKSN